MRIPIFLAHRRRRATRAEGGRVAPRSGVPARGPAPQPRMRWYR